MSNLKRFDVNSGYFKDDWFLLEKDLINSNNNYIIDELKLLTKKHENMVLVTEYYYTTNRKSITNLLKVIIAKDLKVAKVETIKSNSYFKKTIIELSNILMLDFKLEDIFVFISRKNEKIIPNLLKYGFISLSTSEDNGEYIPLMLEKRNESVGYI